MGGVGTQQGIKRKVGTPVNHTLLQGSGVKDLGTVVKNIKQLKVKISDELLTRKRNILLYLAY